MCNTDKNNQKRMKMSFYHIKLKFPLEIYIYICYNILAFTERLSCFILGLGEVYNEYIKKMQFN